MKDVQGVEKRNSNTHLIIPQRVDLTREAIPADLPVS